MLTLPKKDKKGDQYLSYSQINSFNSYKRDYIRGYFFKEEFVSNPYIDFGSLIGEALEKGDFSNFTKKEQEYLKKVPRLDSFEYEIRIEMDGWYVTGFIDSASKDLTHIIDYKTADNKKKESYYRSPEYRQLEIYSLAVKKDTGRLPKKVQVIMIDRKGNSFKGEDLTLGLKTKVVNRKITTKILQDTEEYLQKSAEEISEYYRIFNFLNE